MEGLDDENGYEIARRYMMRSITKMGLEEGEQKLTIVLERFT
jgi:hypothetical protein